MSEKCKKNLANIEMRAKFAGEIRGNPSWGLFVHNLRVLKKESNIMKQSRLLATFLVTVFLVTGLSAQDAVVSGRITDTSGDPLPGANVVVELTNYGGATDVDGNYSFTAQASGQEVKLTARFIGYRTQTVSVTLSAGTITQDFFTGRRRPTDGCRRSNGTC